MPVAAFVGALTTLSTFVFLGGTEGALAKQLQAVTSKPVVILRGDSGLLPRIQVKHDGDMKVLASGVRKKGGFEAGDEKSWGMAPVGWPIYFYEKRRAGWQDIPVTAKLNVEMDGVDVKLVDSGSAYATLDQLAKLTPGLNLTWSPYFAESRFVVSAKSCSLELLLQTVAEAIGAKFTKEDGGGWRYEINPDVYRTRTQGYCRAKYSRDTDTVSLMQNSGFEYLNEVVTRLSNEQIVKFLNGWDGVVVSSPSQPLHTAAMRRLKTHMWAYTQPQVTGEKVLELMQTVDPKDKVRIVLRPDGVIETSVKVAGDGWLGF